MKYKLKKIYPGSPRVGTIIDTHKYTATVMVDCKDYPEYWEESKEVVFTTVDGKDLYKGDLFTYMDNNGYIIKEQRIASVPPIGGKAFSTYEAAQQWLLVHSLQSIVKDAVDNFPHVQVNDFISKLKSVLNAGT